MVARCLMAFVLLLGCAAPNPHADVSWLINENTKEVVGLVGRSTSESSLAHRFVLMECPSYDTFALATEAYHQQTSASNAGSAYLPKECKLLVDEELDKKQLKESKEEVSKKLQKEQLIGGILNDITSGMYSGALFSMLGLSNKNTKSISDLVQKLKDLNILPRIASGGKIKKGFIILSTLAMVATSSGLLKRSGDENYQVVLEELSGAEYQHRLRDQNMSKESYQEIRQLLINLVEEKTNSPQLVAKKSSVSKETVVAH